nr:PREDICTED: uncharacterized protein LOC109036174 [Bemisia tabaci]
MGVTLTRWRSQLNCIVLKWSILNLLSSMSAELTFDKDENATLVPYPLTTQKIVTVLPEVVKSTTDGGFNEGADVKNGTVKLKRLSQKRLDEEIRTRVADGKGGKNPRKNLKIMRTNSTLPTLQRLTAATVARRRGHKKKHSQRGNLVNFVQTTKELTLSGENESESRSYNYDPTYPVYNYQAPTESGEDIMSNFGMVKDMWGGYPESDFQSPTFPSLTTTYAPKMVHSSSPPIPDYSFPDWKPPFLNPPRFRRPMGLEEPPVYVDYVDDTRVINLDGLGRYWPPGHPPILIRTGYHRYQDEDSIEYHQFRDHEEHHGGWDLSKLAMIVLTKLGLFKLKLFVLLKLAILFFFKMKVLLMALFLKLLMLMKAAKLLKLLFVPFLIMFLAPLIALLLTPLLALLPMLLNAILNNVTVPVFVPNGDEEEPEMRTPEDDDVSESRAPLTPATLLQFKMILSSEECLKRVVCEMAARRKPPIKSVVLARLLDLVAAVVPYRTVKTYVQVYKSGLYVQESRTEPWCSSQYACSLKSQTS